MKKNSNGRSVSSDSASVSRRRFLQIAGITTLSIPLAGFGNFIAQGVNIIIDSVDATAMSGPVQWAAKELEAALSSKGIGVKRSDKISGTASGDLCIVLSGSTSAMSKELLKDVKTKIPAVPEALGLFSIKSAGIPVLLASGFDNRGLVYAVLELADRVNNATDAIPSLTVQRAIVEHPANELRSLNRLFCSDIEDKPWYNDREMWPKYLTMLAGQRYNRFNLSMGIGYDFLRNVTDGYFLFPYPFLLPVPGYNVAVPELSDAERDRNLDMLKFISKETVARGMEFRLGIWMHGYVWENSPNPNYTIKGLSAANHGPYCRDAMRALLQACPDISGVTLRIHGESGVTEGSYDFWKYVFDGVASCGRKVEMDLHTKGIDEPMINTAIASGVPFALSPKYWAEHLGLPYHQADIRNLEVPVPNKQTSGLMNLSDGSRSFMRYGYGDLLKEERPYKMIHRIWPGTQRILMSGDPLMTAELSRAFNFCGSIGAELMEPLSFKGRRGSGIAGDRCAYLDSSLKPTWDWQKYEYGLRLFGRLLYNPSTDPEVWKRHTRTTYGSSSAEPIEQALATATRILPIVLTAHGTSAGNNTYWPEMYVNHAISNAGIRNPYTDTPSPRVFGNVSPMDPQLFIGINNYAAELLKGERSGKYSPIEAAVWIEDLAESTAKSLAQAEAKTLNKQSIAFRRMSIDVSAQIALGRFFGTKFRSGVLYAIFQQTGDRVALDEAVKAYRKAREIWAVMANKLKDVYKSDVTIGENTHLRGHWLDRLPTMDLDIEDMAKKLDTENAKAAAIPQTDHVKLAISEALGRPQRPAVVGRHTVAAKFQSGQALNLQFSFDKMPKSAILFYRHINQGERFESLDLTISGKNLTATIPGEYTNSPYPLQYYVELRETPAKAWLYPGFETDLMNQPYFVVRKA